MSSLCKGHSKFVAIDKRTHIVFSLATDAKVSW